MKVSYAPRHPYLHNGCWQSDALVKHKGLSSRVTIFANQPISYTDGKFELDPKDIAEKLCYQKFKVDTVVCHDLREGTQFEQEIRDALEELMNL